MQPNQILAITIFVLMFAAIIYGKIHRYIPALIGAALIISVVFLGVMRSPQAVTSVLNFGALVQRGFWWPGHTPFESHGVNWQTVIFIAGMMVMVEGMAEVGFFRWLCLYVARIARCRVVPIMVIFMLLSGFLAMFIDSITVLLFMATVTIELARLLEFDPAPVIITEIFAANVGGSATMSGDPPNIIIGTGLGYNFMNFAANTGLIAWICMIVICFYFYFVMRKSLKQSTHPDEIAKTCPMPGSAITDRRLFYLNLVVFILTITLIITHAESGLSMPLIGVIAAILTLLVNNKNILAIGKAINWHTLLFFLGLFICVGGLEQTGVLADSSTDGPANCRLDHGHSVVAHVSGLM